MGPKGKIAFITEIIFSLHHRLWKTLNHIEFVCSPSHYRVSHRLLPRYKHYCCLSVSGQSVFLYVEFVAEKSQWMAGGPLSREMLNNSGPFCEMRGHKHLCQLLGGVRWGTSMTLWKP